MIRKICCTVLMMAAAFTNVFANQIDESNRILSTIKKGVCSQDSGYYMMQHVYDKVDALESETATAMLRQVNTSCERSGNEKMSYCAALLSGVYHINHGKFSEALKALSIAEEYSHEFNQIDYINFLKSICYIRTGRTHLIDHSLEHILSHPCKDAGSFQNVVYCESLKAMSIYNEYNGKAQEALKDLDRYCDMQDTLCCGHVSDVYYFIPKFISDKYLDRKAAESYLINDTSIEPKTVFKDIALALSMITALSFGANIYLKRKNHFLKKSGEQVAETGDPSALAFAPLSALVGTSSNAISVVNTDGSLSWVNSGFEKMYGYSKSEYILSFGNNVFSRSKMEERRKAFARCSEKLKPQIYTAKITSGYNTEIWIQGTISPILENGVISKYLVIDTDITSIKKEKQVADAANTLITGNLKNASTIQKTLLPTKTEISKVFENFIIYKPKDIVSGDFYWFNRLDGSYYFALGDCTGHGVSGSLLGVLSMKTLDEIVLGSHITDPKDILYRMDNAISKSLKQDDNDNMDGLDITVCKITLTDNGADIVVAGAKSYFLYNTDGKTTLVRGSKHSVGGFIPGIASYDFENHELSLKKGDIIYFASDGIIDQNNHQRRSLGRQRFFDIIDSATTMEMSEQEEYILKSVSEWAEGEPQRDDICVAGIRI